MRDRGRALLHATVTTWGYVRWYVDPLELPGRALLARAGLRWRRGRSTPPLKVDAPWTADGTPPDGTASEAHLWATGGRGGPALGSSS